MIAGSLVARLFAPLMRAGLLLWASVLLSAGSSELVSPPASLLAPGQGPTRLLRYPDLYGDRLVFCYGGDLWTAPAAGGTAIRLTAHPGLELFPKFSPDGRWIAFTGQYDGDEQVYVIPAGGGVPRQLTFYPAEGPLYPWWGVDNQVLGWTPDGRSVLFRSLRDSDEVLCESGLYTIALDGGPARRLPVAGSGAGAFAPDGERLALEPAPQDFSNWKRYRGGRAQDLQFLDLASGARSPVAAGREPMWVGEQLLFTADGDGARNLYRRDPGTGQVAQVSFHAVGDVRWPSTDHVQRIVYERDFELRILDLASGDDRAVPIRVPTDGGASRPTRVEAEVQEFGLSPRGERALFVARGDVFTVPIENGPVRNLTHRSRSREKLARWSPDGRTIAYVSDAAGEDQVYLVDQAGAGSPKALTSTLRRGVSALAWAPDGARLAMVDGQGGLLVLNLADRVLNEVAREAGGAEVDLAWAPDGQFLAYTLSAANGMGMLFLWSAAEDRSRPASSDLFPVQCPAWDPRGGYLYFLSRRSYATQRSALEPTFTAAGNWGVFALALRRDLPHPFPPLSDEVGPAPARADRRGPVRVDWQGLEARVASVPVAVGSLSRLLATEGRLLYFREGAKGRPALCLFDAATRTESVLAEGVDDWVASAEGTHVLVRKNGEFTLLEARSRPGEGRPVSTRRLVVDAVPAEEWAQIFDEVWRRYRDFFYARNMHGRDWRALGERYRPLLRYVTHRSDLTYLLSELAGELNVGHAYLGGGDYFQPQRPRPGLPGALFQLDPVAGRYRIQRIYRGANEEPGYRSPLTEVGVDAQVGDYVLAIDGQELKAGDDPYRLLRNRDRIVTLTLNAQPVLAGARRVSYLPVESETALRYLDFVLRSRDRVTALSGGRLGYLHLPDMGEAGLAEFVKWYFPQIRKAGLIVDVRGNRGGSQSQAILESLGRKLLGVNFRAGSDRARTYPDAVFQGPMACLIDGNTASDGEIFAYHFRGMGLGPLIGTRTWGGVVGYLDRGPLLDGGFAWVPTEGTCDAAGAWIIEGQGVAPDLQVENDPRALLDGHDLQLERAVLEVLERLDGQRPGLPGRPADPVK
jgi:tricorn protease